MCVSARPAASAGPSLYRRPTRGRTRPRTEVRRRSRFPHQQSVEAFQAQVAACKSHDAEARLSEIAAPTLVIAGEFDNILPPRFGRAVAAQIPGARFEVFEGEAHQPFQEIPDEFNARVDEFWRDVDAHA